MRRYVFEKKWDNSVYQLSILLEIYNAYFVLCKYGRARGRNNFSYNIQFTTIFEIGMFVHSCLKFIFNSIFQVFEDAVEELPVAPLKEKKVLKKFSKLKKIKVLKSSDGDDDIPLDDALEAAREAIDKFLNNNFDEARDIVQPLWAFRFFFSIPYIYTMS